MPIDVRATKPEEYRRASSAVSAALLFPPHDDETWERARPSWDEQSSTSAWDGEHCVGHASQFFVDTTVPGGARLLTGAVTRVGVLPTHRRRGIATALLEALIAEAAQRKAVLMSLRASEAVIYGRYGFGMAGEFTEIGTSARALTDDEKKMLQAMADEYHKKLIDDIKASRPAIKDNNAFDGRIFTGTQAQKIGLVDSVGDLDQAIQLAAQVGCPGQNVRPGVVMYRRGNDPARSIYAVTANIPLQGAGLFPSVPGIDRAKLPTFLSAWQPELTMERLGGK